MKTRVISAAVLIVIVAACFITSPLTRLLFLFVAAELAVWELCRALKQTGVRCPTWVLYIFTAAAALFLWLGCDAEYMAALFFAACAVILSCGVISREIGGKGALSALAILVYPLIPFIIIIYLSLKGNTILIPVFTVGCISAWLCDAFALFGGKRFGKHKLAPEVSPNKTVEGSLCGAAASVVGGFILYFCLKSGCGMRLIPCILTSLIASTFGQMGDLAASLIKRMCGLKDYSKLIPGHGGVMDRIDSLLFSIPTAYFCFLLMRIF